MNFVEFIANLVFEIYEIKYIIHDNIPVNIFLGEKCRRTVCHKKKPISFFTPKCPTPKIPVTGLDNDG